MPGVEMVSVRETVSGTFFAGETGETVSGETVSGTFFAELCLIMTGFD